MADNYDVIDANGSRRTIATAESAGVHTPKVSVTISTVGIDQVTANANEVVLKASSAIVGATKDAGPNWTSAFGVSSAKFQSADATTAAAVTDAPTSGQKLVITDILVGTDTAMRADFQEETSGTIIASIYLAANSTVQWTPRGKVKLATADKKLMIDASASGNVAVTVCYWSEA